MEVKYRDTKRYDLDPTDLEPTRDVRRLTPDDLLLDSPLLTRGEPKGSLYGLKDRRECQQ